MNALIRTSVIRRKISPYKIIKKNVARGRICVALWGKVGYYPKSSWQWGAHILVFIGTYEHTIDAKNRLAIPSDVRAQIRAASGADPSDSIGFYVTLGEAKALYLYTESGFEQRAVDLIQSDADPDQLLVYERLYFSLTRRVEMDSVGRIRLPENLIKLAALGNDVVLLGVNDHFEIRDREIWYTDMGTLLKDERRLLMDPRRAMRQSRTRGK